MSPCSYRAHGSLDPEWRCGRELGQTLEDTSAITQPLRWKARWFSPVAGGTYDVRARQWSPELGVFLGIDEFRFRSKRTTLWGWPGQNPMRFGDPKGRNAAIIAGGIALGAAAFYYYFHERFVDEAEGTGLPGPNDGPQDAYRHCLASCVATGYLGSGASEFLGDLNESSDDHSASTEMDRNNNSAGRELGNKSCDATPEKGCRDRCGDALRNGRLQTEP